MSQICKEFSLSKSEADKLIRAYFSKYESKSQGIFVANYLTNGTLATKIVTNDRLREIAKYEILSLYLIAVRSLKRISEPLDYEKLQFASKSRQTAEPAHSNETRPVFNQLSDNQPLKRSSTYFPLGTDGPQKELVKMKEEKTETQDPNQKKPAPQPAKTSKPASLMSFFSKK